MPSAEPADDGRADGASADGPAGADGGGAVDAGSEESEAASGVEGDADAGSVEGDADAGSVEGDADARTVECRGCGATNTLAPRSTRMTCTACGATWAWVRCTRFRCHKVTAVAVGDPEPTCRYCNRTIKLNWPALHRDYQRRLADGIEEAPAGERLVLGAYWLHPDAFGSAGEVALGDAEYTGGDPDHEETGAMGALALAPTGVRFTPFGEEAFAGWREVDALALEDEDAGSVLKVRTEAGDVLRFRTAARIPGKARRKLTVIDAQLREKVDVLHRLAMGPADPDVDAEEGSGGSGGGGVEPT